MSTRTAKPRKLKAAIRDNQKLAVTEGTRHFMLQEIKRMMGATEKYHSWYNRVYQLRSQGLDSEYETAIQRKYDACNRLCAIIDKQPVLTKIRTGAIPDSQCPKCGGNLLVINKKNRGVTIGVPPQFVGCSNFPQCGYRKPVTHSIKTVMDKVQAEADLQPAEF